MINLFSENFDVVDYTTNDIEKVANVISSVSEEARKAYIPAFEEQQDLNTTQVALILKHPTNGVLKKFACFNSNLTELNLALLAKYKDNLPEEIVKTAAANLTASARRFDLPIPEELEQYKSNKFVPREVNVLDIDLTNFYLKQAACKKSNKSMEKKSKKALPGLNKAPLDSKADVVKSASWFGRNWQKLSVDEQLEFINNIKTEAKDLNVNLEKTAMANFVDLKTDEFNPQFSAHIHTRKNYLRDDQEDISEAYSELITRSAELGILKTAYLVEALDKEAGLDYYWGDKINDPLRTVMFMEKKATANIDGFDVSLDQLKKLDVGDLTGLLGSEGVTELRGNEGLDILASLPRPIRAEILNLL